MGVGLEAILMLAYGNGKAPKCVLNLLSMVRGECPYERCKGLDSSLTGRPAGEVAGLLAEDVAWVIDNYEPRVTNEGTALVIKDVLNGSGRISADIDVKEE